jgi:hypothetical protein
MAKFRKKSSGLFAVSNPGPHSGTHKTAPGIVFGLLVSPTCGKSQFYGRQREATSESPTVRNKTLSAFARLVIVYVEFNE